MILKNNEHPDGVELKRDRSIMEEAPCTVRKMTAEDWEKYGELNPVEVNHIKTADPLAEFNIWIPTAEDCDFAQRMREERNRRGMSQKKLGQVVGVSGTAIAHYESLKYKPNKEIREKLEKVLGLSLMSWTDGIYLGQ